MYVWKARLSYLDAERQSTINAYSADDQSSESISRKNGIRWTAIGNGQLRPLFLFLLKLPVSAKDVNCLLRFVPYGKHCL